jgi:parallel beta-helix repeat protein
MISQVQNFRPGWIAGLGLMAIMGLGMTVEQVQAETQPTPAQPTAVQSSTVQHLYVNPSMGSSATGSGEQATPFKTITQALNQAKPGTTIHLNPGRYTELSGEQFPLIVPQGVTLQGDTSSQGQTVVIEGGSYYASSWWGRQNIALLAKADSVIEGVSVTNPNGRGTGIWIESSNATVRNSSFSGSQREGIFVAGRSTPLIENNLFRGNAANGLSITNESKGKIVGNTFDNTGFGIAISDSAAPEIINNRIVNNLDGILVSHQAKPIILGNQIENNRRDGVVAISQAMPNLGTPETPGRNRLINNGRHAIYNASQNPQLPTMGNEVVGGSALNDPAGGSPIPTNVTSSAAATSATANNGAPITAISTVDLRQTIDQAQTIQLNGKVYVLKEDVMDLAE